MFVLQLEPNQMCALPYTVLNLRGKWHNAYDPTVSHSNPVRLQATYTTMYQWHVENESETEDFSLLESDAVPQSPTFRRVMVPLLWQLAPEHKDSKHNPTGTESHYRSLDPSATLLLQPQTSDCEMRVRGKSPIQRVNLSLTCLSLPHSYF